MFVVIAGMGPSHLWHGVVFEVVVLHPVVSTKIHETHEKQWLLEYFYDQEYELNMKQYRLKSRI